MTILSQPKWIALNRHFALVGVRTVNSHRMEFFTYSACQAFAAGGDVFTWEIVDCGETWALDRWEDAPYGIRGELKSNGCIDWETNPAMQMHGCVPSQHQSLITDLFQTIFHYGARELSLEGEPLPLPAGVTEL